MCIVVTESKGREKFMAKVKKNVKEVGPIGVRVVRDEELELFQTDLSYKYHIPFHGTPLELAGFLYSLADWLQRYGTAQSAEDVPE